ncbi:MAG: hypothetical protein K2I46_05875 [Clostridia bacterium]|nr:hypothetical protein [Clostridia bacterium]MDE6472789.1 hypothetical protein [Clostridia bacterium]
MSFVSGFKGLPRLVQIILLLIPGVNWITEIVVRGSAAMHGKALKQIIILIFAILPTGFLLGWIDLFSCLIQKKLILT